MILETSCGIIPLKLLKEEWQVFLVQLHAGHWSFPKGHVDGEESQQETAERELLEETGLKVKRYFSTTPLEEKYVFQQNGKLIHKTVFFFVAEVKGKVQLQQEEIRAGEWLSFEEAAKLLDFASDQTLLQLACRLIS